MNKEHVTVHITREANNNSFVDSKIYGGVKIDGKNTNFIRTHVYKFKKESPVWFWVGIIASIFDIIMFIIYIF